MGLTTLEKTDLSNAFRFDEPTRVRLRCGAELIVEYVAGACCPIVHKLAKGVCLAWLPNGRYAMGVDSPFDVVEAIAPSGGEKVQLEPGEWIVEAIGDDRFYHNSVAMVSPAAEPVLDGRRWLARFSDGRAWRFRDDGTTDPDDLRIVRRHVPAEPALPVVPPIIDGFGEYWARDVRTGSVYRTEIAKRHRTGDGYVWEAKPRDGKAWRFLSNGVCAWGPGGDAVLQKVVYRERDLTPEEAFALRGKAIRERGGRYGSLQIHGAGEECFYLPGGAVLPLKIASEGWELTDGTPLFVREPIAYQPPAGTQAAGAKASA